MKTLRIGTRGSPLALWQARAVESALKDAGGPRCEVITISTTGDRLAQAVLADVGGKSVFVKEIEEALLNDTVDLAVHSAKDLPADLPAGLAIVAALPRADPRDAIVLPREMVQDAGPTPRLDPTSRRGTAQTMDTIMSRITPPARVGTGSVRRVAQLTRHFPHVSFEQIRGNVETRLRKLDDNAFDAIVLAAAGLQRLGLADRISAPLSVEECVPAPGQGIVALETRADDDSTRSALTTISDTFAMASLRAERAVMTALGGDCHVPIGAIAIPDGAELSLRAIVASIDGATLLVREGRGALEAAAHLGGQVATDLIADGAADIIAAGRPRAEDS